MQKIPSIFVQSCHKLLLHIVKEFISFLRFVHFLYSSMKSIVLMIVGVLHASWNVLNSAHNIHVCMLAF